MQDTCIIQSYSRTIDTYGAPIEVYADGSPIACGVDTTPATEQRRADMNIENITATVRLPISTVIKSSDHIKITARYGVALSDTPSYEVIGDIRRGPSGLQVDIQVICP